MNQSLKKSDLIREHDFEADDSKYNRSGTIAARLLAEFGMKPEKPIAEVRKVRPGAIETAEQERFIRGLKQLPPS